MIMPAPGSAIDRGTASAIIDLAAYRANLGRIRAVLHDAAPQLMAVVKADGYGHGLVECARAAREAGCEWIGAATPGEALAVRASGDAGPVLCWLYGEHEDLGALVAADIGVTVHRVDQLDRVGAAAAALGRTADVHLKIDTGLSRNGSTVADWPALCAATAQAVQAGTVRLVSIWSHLATGDEPGHRAVRRQLDRYAAALQVAAEHGLRPELRHLAASGGALLVPEARYDLVRIGIASYGLDPAPGVAALAGVELQPAMTLRAQLVAVKPLAAGEAVSYGHTWTAPEPTTVGLVPLGYADGIPRHGSNLAEVWVGQRRAPIRGIVCMDQFVVDLGPDAPDRPGDEVVLFGPGGDGEPTVAEWADWCDTIGYEIVTRIGHRVPRRYVDPGR